MCCFDCKCESLNWLGENINKQKETNQKQKSFKKNKKQQKYRISSPRTTQNISAEVRGLDILYFCSVCFMFFSKLFWLLFCFFLFCLCFRLVYLSFCIYNRNNTYKNRTNIKSFEKNKKNIISQPEPERYLFAVGSRAGYPVFLFCFFCFSRSFSVVFLFLCFFHVFA